MKKYGIKKVMVTITFMSRLKLITKEKMEKYCMGEMGTKESVNDNLELFFEDIRLGNRPGRVLGITVTNFLPKLTEEELDLVERKDGNFMKTFSVIPVDVDKAEIDASESNSKFLRGYCWRNTFELENSSPQNVFTCCFLL